MEKTSCIIQHKRLEFNYYRSSHHHIWTKKDVTYLINNYTLSDEILAQHLNRSRLSICRKRNKLRLLKNNKITWTPDKIKFLKEHWKNVTYKELTQYLGTTKTAIATERRKLGLVYCKRSRFSKYEKEFIEHNYAHETDKKIGEKLNRSRESISKYRNKNNFKKINKKEWTTDEITKLKKYYGESPLNNLFPDRNRASILHKAVRLGLRENMEKNLNYKVNSNFFQTWNPQSAYITGVFLADGWIKIPDGNRNNWNIGFGAIDYDWVKEIHDILESKHPIREEIYKTKKGLSTSYKFIIGSKIMAQNLLKIGIMPNKSLIATYPNIPSQYNRECIRGIFDGDGNIIITTHRNKKYIYAGITGTLEVLQTIKNIINKKTYVQGGKIYRKCDNKKNTWYLLFAHYDSLRFLFWIYNNSILYLKRKRNIFYEALYDSSVPKTPFSQWKRINYSPSNSSDELNQIQNFLKENKNV